MNKKGISENSKIALEIEDNQNIAAKLIIASEKLALQIIETEKRSSIDYWELEHLTRFSKFRKEKRAARILQRIIKKEKENELKSWSQ
jgi:hypothetical protein